MQYELFFRHRLNGIAEGSVHNLISTALDRSVEVNRRLEAIAALNRDPMPYFIYGPLLSIATEASECPSVRAAAIYALGESAPRSAIQGKLELLANHDTHHVVRDAADRALTPSLAA
jgi:hypothetical protein